MVDTQQFQGLLNDWMAKAGRVGQGVDEALQWRVPMAPLQEAGNAVGLGRGIGHVTRSVANNIAPFAALAGGLEGLQQGPLQGLAGAGGGFGGGMAATALNKVIAAAPLPGLVKAPLMLASAVGLPALASKAAIGVSDALIPGAQAATNAATQTVGTQLNPYSTPNVADSSAADILAQAKTIQETFGDVAAREFLLSKQRMDALGDFDERRARTAMMVAPVRTAGRLAEIGAGGAANMYLAGINGANQALSNMTARNPYAEMLS